MSSPARYELKFLAGETAFHEVRHWIGLQREGFVERYPERWVNSIYFDTPSLEAYTQSLAGGSDRRKVRYRWYGELEPVRSGQLEVKSRRNRLGCKFVYPIGNPDTPIIESASLVTWLRDTASAEGRHWLSMYTLPTSVTRYLRCYYATTDDRVRITLDTSLQLFDQRHSRRLNFRWPLPGPAIIVVEIKFDQKDEELARPVAERLPLRISRFSKYVSGVSRSGLI